MKEKRYFIKDEVDVKDFAKAMKQCKEFSPEKQKELLLMIMETGISRYIAPEVKKKRAQKKIIKKYIKELKEDLDFQMLDMLTMKEVEKSFDPVLDKKEANEMFDALMEIAK